MARVTMSDRLIEAANDLLSGRPKSATYRRSAVSSAYYAVFHALAQLCADVLLPEDRADADMLRVYRGLDHGPLRNAFGKSPLKDDLEMKQIGLIVGQLQNARHQADYYPADLSLFPEDEARQLVDQARIAIRKITELEAANRLTLATSLLFKERTL